MQTDKVLVESSMVVLTSKEFQGFIKTVAPVKKISTGAKAWIQGSAQDFANRDIESILIEFVSPVSLKKLSNVVMNSQFRFSLDHFRRPGQPIGTSIAENEAAEKAQGAATAAATGPQAQRPQAQRPQAQRPQAQRPQAQRPQSQRPRVVPNGKPQQISAERSTAIPPDNNTGDIPFSIQRTAEGKYYVDYSMKYPDGSYKYFRIKGATEAAVRTAVSQAIQQR